MKLIFAGKEPFYDNFVSVCFDYAPDTTDAKLIIKSFDFEKVLDKLTEDSPDCPEEAYTVYAGDWKLFGIDSLGNLIEFDCNFNIELRSSWKVVLNETK